MQATEGEIQALYLALTSRDSESWEGVWHQWRPRVATWVRRHPQFVYTGEEVAYFVNRAFEKLWRAVDGHKLEHFANPAQLIQYFKLCVHSVVLDELRGVRAESAASVSAVSIELADIPSAAPDAAESAMLIVRREELWNAVAVHARTPGEKIVVAAALVHGLPPREIANRYPGLFGSVAEVYRIKRNLLERLSRDKQLRTFV